MRVSGEIVNCIGLGFAFSDTSYKIDTWKQWRCLVQLTCKYNNMAKLSQVSESSCLKLEKIKRSTIKTDKKGAVKQDIPLATWAKLVIETYPMSSTLTWFLLHCNQWRLEMIFVKADAYMSSWKSSKEGDLPLCILPNREIQRETIPRY